MNFMNIIARHGKTKIDKKTVIHGFHVNVTICTKEQYPFPVLSIKIYFQSIFNNINTGNLFVTDDMNLPLAIPKSFYRNKEFVPETFQTEKFTSILQSEIIPWIINQIPYMVEKSRRKLFNRTGV